MVSVPHRTSDSVVASIGSFHEKVIALHEARELGQRKGAEAEAETCSALAISGIAGEFDSHSKIIQPQPRYQTRR